MGIEQMRILRRKMIDSYKKGDFEGSLAHGRRLIESYNGSREAPTMERADDYFNCALICAQLGQYAKAIELYTKSYVLVRHLCGESPEFACRLTNLAVCYIEMGNSDVATGLFKKADELLTEHAAYHDDLELSREYRNNMYNLANAYQAAGLYDLAIKTHERHMSLYSVKDSYYADSLNCIGYAYEELELYEQAHPYFAEALKIKNSMFGVLSDEYIADLVHYADSLRRAGNYKAAMGMFTRAAGYIKKGFTETNAMYIKLITKAALCAEILGLLDKALTLRKRIARVTKRVAGTKHMFYAECLREVGGIYRLMNEHEKALKHMLAALKLTRRLIGENNPLYLRDVAVACDLYIKLNRHSDAIKLIGEKI